MKLLCAQITEKNGSFLLKKVVMRLMAITNELQYLNDENQLWSHPSIKAWVHQNYEVYGSNHFREALLPAFLMSVSYTTRVNHVTGISKLFSWINSLHDNRRGIFVFYFLIPGKIYISFSRVNWSKMKKWDSHLLYVLFDGKWREVLVKM